MNDDKQINEDNISDLNFKKDIKPFSIIDINQTDTTQENESINQINESIQLIKIDDINKNEKEICNNINKKSENIIKTIFHNDKNKENNNKSNKKSSLKGSKKKINYIKEEILNLFDEDKIMERIEYYQINNNIINIDKIYKFQEIYESKLEKLFNNKIEKIDEINEKYNSDLNELNYCMEKEKEDEEKNGNNNEDNSSGVNSIYDGLLKDKNNELNQLKKKYEENYESIKNEYMNNINLTKYDKYYTELFANIKQDILNIIKPKNDKKVSFDK